LPPQRPLFYSNFLNFGLEFLTSIQWENREFLSLLSAHKWQNLAQFVPNLSKSTQKWPQELPLMDPLFHPPVAIAGSTVMVGLVPLVCTVEPRLLQLAQGGAILTWQPFSNQLIFIWTGQLRANSKSPQNKSKLKNLEVLVVFVCISGILALCGCVVPPPPPPRHGRGRGGGRVCDCFIPSHPNVKITQKIPQYWPIQA